MSRNVAFHNKPADIVWDQTGTGNRFRRNLCAVSMPSGICDRAGCRIHSAPRNACTAQRRSVTSTLAAGNSRDRKLPSYQRCIPGERFTSGSTA